MSYSPTTPIIVADDAGCRLDILLSNRANLSRSQVRRLLAGGFVQVNGQVVTEKQKGLKLSAGDRVQIASPEELGTIAPQPEMPLVMLAQGDGWVVVDKPAGVPVHPLSPGERDTVMNAAVARWPGIQGIGEGALRSGVVHRLDVDTSGALVIATSQAAWAEMRAAFDEHRAEKIYRAIVHGKLRRDGESEMDLVIAQHRPARVRVVGEGERRPAGARRCDLSWRVVERFASATLVEVRLGTGFLHQIRVMFAKLGHAVVGDKVYGVPGDAMLAPTLDAPRQMLHASRIAAGPAAAESPDPPDFTAILNGLRSV